MARRVTSAKLLRNSIPRDAAAVRQATQGPKSLHTNVLRIEPTNCTGYLLNGPFWQGFICMIWVPPLHRGGHCQQNPKGYQSGWGIKMASFFDF